MAPSGRRRAPAVAPGRAWLPHRGVVGFAVAAAAAAVLPVALAVQPPAAATGGALEEAVAVGNATAVADGAEPGRPTARVAAGVEAEDDGVLLEANNTESTSSFDYHKSVFPMDWAHDGLTITLAVIGLMIAASGGIGGGGILVPVYMLALGFKPKHAIALSNFTILGGSIANTVVNTRKRHPKLDKPLIDWDLILIMEPLTIFGAVFGSLMGKILPNIILTVSLVLILTFMGYRTFTKGLKMWREETERMTVRPAGEQDGVELRDASARELRAAEAAAEVELTSVEKRPPPAAGSAASAAPAEPRGGAVAGESFGVAAPKKDVEYCEMDSDSEGRGGRHPPAKEKSVRFKISSLSACFAGICVLTVLKGGGSFPSPLGFPCGSSGFWALYFSNVPWVLAFAFAFRWLLVGEFQAKVRSGHTFIQGEVKWDSRNTIKYPMICAISGLLAGLFGVGGGIVKGPLMLEMGIIPSVASASAAAMILFTSAAASTSFVVFGLLHLGYGCVFFIIGFISTLIGQYGVGRLVEKHNRQSPIVLSIGMVICLSSLMVFVQDIIALSSGKGSELFRFHDVCTSEA